MGKLVTHSDCPLWRHMHHDWTCCYSAVEVIFPRAKKQVTRNKIDAMFSLGVIFTFFGVLW